MTPPGLLVLVVGPSGAGKDAVIGGARALLGEAVVVARRCVTRPPSPAEDNIELSAQAFAAAREAGAYCLSWEAHGHGYGVPASVVDRLGEGRTVVANVSRTVVEEARRRFRCLVVEITAPQAVLERRRAERRRDSDQRSTDRAERITPALRPDHVIVNDGPLDAAVADFGALIRQARAASVAG